MPKDMIRYDVLAQEAFRGLVKKVLTEVSHAGLPGDHHFYVMFDTRAPGVRISARLKERYPEEMTIVIQHWFENLTITPEGFHITLNFGNSPEPLYVPFDALRTFVDPSVEFGLRFENHEEDDEGDEDDLDDESALDVEDDDEPTEERPKGGAEVVSLDKWRK